MLRKIVTLFLLLIAVCSFVLIYYFMHIEHAPKIMFEYSIVTQWNSIPVDHDPVKIKLLNSATGGHIVTLEIDAPFFDDPGSPGGGAGDAFSGPLWDYEVVEVFFHGERENYLELEFCPHGQHLVLLLNKVRESFKKELPLKFGASIDRKNKRWYGKAVIPSEYFPPKVSRFNAYAIHGSGKKRTYEALYPVPKDQFEEPNFHRLEFFKSINFKALLEENWSKYPALDYWEGKE